MFFFERTSNGLVVNPPLKSMNQEEKKVDSKAMLPQASFENSEAGFLKIKEELPSFCSPSTSLTSHERSEELFTPSQSSIYSSLGFPTSAEPTKTKPQKKRSTVGPKSSNKKMRTNYLPDAPNDQNLDKDLMGLVGSINTEKQLDSDTSEDTIILDDDSLHDTPLSVKLEPSAINSKEKTIPNNSTNFNNFSSLFLLSNFQSINEEKNSNSSMRNTSFNLSVDNKAPQLSAVSLQPSKYSIQENKQLSPSLQNKIESKEFDVPKSNTSLLEEALRTLPSIKKSNIPEISSPQNVLPNITLTVKNPKSRSKNNSVRRQRKSPKKISSRAKQSSVKNIKWALSNSCNLSQKSNYQSYYASTGLDDDLCDTDNKRLPKLLNIASKESCTYESHVKEVNNAPLGVSIKIEKDDASFTQCHGKEKAEQLIGDFHVSMTFEAESPGEEDDFDDDLPLLLLKNQKLANEMGSKINKDTKEVHNTDSTVAFDPTLFVKKELIEDEIVSESQVISSKNLVSTSNDINNFPFNNSSIISQPNFTAVKIKTEPIDTEISSASIAKSTTLNSKKTDSNKVFAYNAAYSPAASAKGNQNRSSVLNSQIDKEVDLKNMSSSTTSLIKSEYANKMNTGNISSISTVISPSNEISNLYESDVSSTYSESALHSQNLTHDFQSANLTNTSKATKKTAKTSKKKINTRKNTTVMVQKSAPENLVPSDASEKDVNIDTSFDDNASDSDLSSHQGDSSAMKNINRKKTKKQDNVDENLPITLLLKRQTSDSSAPDSFICTDISNKSEIGNNESNSVYRMSSENVEKCNKNPSSILQNNANVASTSEVTAAGQTKKKAGGKKKQTKVKTKKNVINNAIIEQPDPKPSTFKIPVFSNNSNLNNLESSINTPVNSKKIAKNVNENMLYGQIKGSTISLKELAGDTVDLMEFEEQSPHGVEVDDTIASPIKNTNEPFNNDYTMDSLSASPASVSFIKRAKSGSESPISTESKTLDISNNSSVDSQRTTPLSTLSSHTSSSNVEGVNSFSKSLESSPSTIKKKKKRPKRSFGWYKKKKKKTKTEIFIPEDTSEVHESATAINANDNILSSTKIPVVIVKKFQSVETATNQNIDEDLDLEQQSTLHKTLSLEQEPVGGKKPKGKKRKGNKGTQSKRKKSLVKLSNQPNEISLNDGEAECNIEIEDHNAEYNNQQNESSMIVERNDHSNLSQLNNEIDHCQSVAEKSIILSTADDVISGGNEKPFPSLNVDEIAQEIATFEALINRSENTSILSKTPAPNNSSKENQIKNVSNSLGQNHNTNAEFNDISSNNASKYHNIPVKKEIDNCNSEISKKLPNQNSQTVLSVSNGKAVGTSQLDTIILKREKDAEKQSFIGEKNRSCAALSNSTVHQNEKITTIIDSEPSSNITDINSLGLSIKKEVCEAVKQTESANNFIKDQNDLIQRVCGSYVSETSRTHPKHIHSDTFVSTYHNFSSTDLNDDEIQVVPIEKDKSKSVPIVDLTDDSTKLQQEIVNKISTTLLPESYETENLISENTSDISIAKESAPALIENSHTLTEKYISSVQIAKSDNIQSKSKSIKKEKDVLTSLSADEKVVDSKTNNEEKNNLFIGRDTDEYFSHPFPPSIVLYNKKQRKRNAFYSRVDSNVMNLSIDEVASRLKQSEYNNPPKKLGDIKKIEKYPVSFDEIECYHRILGVAPSRKLLSKCYSPYKFSTSIKKGVSNFLKAGQEENMNESKADVEINHTTCTLGDIIGGITAIKEMYSDPIVKYNSTVYERNCPSADTRDSFESHVSNISSLSQSALQSKDMKTSINLFSDKENELTSISRDACSSGRNSTTSCAASDIHDSLKYDNSNMDFSMNSSSQNNPLTNLVLPNTPTVGNTVDGLETNLSFIDTFRTTFNSLAARNDTSGSSLIFDQTEQVPHGTVVDTYGNEAAKSNLNVFDLPVAELRNILLTAGNINSNTVGNDDNAAWKSAATFEYNHTQSTPVLDADSNKSKNIQNLKSHNFDNSDLNVDLDSAQQEGNSDDDYIDAEMINNESELEEGETTPDSREQINEEPVSMPVYKSKWEKIMERKSHELNEKEKISEHLLKDCFPVSSRIKALNTKTTVSAKSALKSSSKESQKSSTKEQNKTAKKQTNTSLKQDNFKIKLDANEEKHAKSIEKSKNKKSKNKAEPKSIKKNIVLKEDSEDTSDLFVPDKVIKVPCSKTVESKKPNEKDKKAKRFYGNRVTNRGTFLTEPKSSPLMKSIKIPKKKKSDINKKPVNARSEEFHQYVKSPNINIESSVSKYKKAGNNSLKNREFYKSPLSDTSPSTSTHFVRTKRMRDKQLKYLNLPYSSQGNMPRKFSPLYNKSSSVHPYRMACSETFQGRKIPVLDMPRAIPSIFDNELNRKTQRSISNPYTGDNSVLCQQAQVMNDSPSTSTQIPPKSFPSTADQSMVDLKKIINQILNPVLDGNIPPVHGSLNSTRESSMFNSLSVCESTVKQNLLPSALLSVPFGNQSSAPLDPRLAASRINAVPSVLNKNQDDPSFSPVSPVSPITNSPVTPPANSGSLIMSPPPKKATCLVPQHLKTLVGHKTIETKNVRLLMLEWNVDWLMQQQQFQDPPPISNALKKVVGSYESFEDYYNTYFPLLLLETWHRIYISWTHLNQASPYSCQITMYSVKNHYVSIECQTVFNTDIHPRRVFPDEGSILLVKYSTKSKEYTIKILGYVTQVKTRRFNSVTDSKIFSSLKLPKDLNTKPEVLQILTLTFMGAYNSEDIDKRQPIRIHVLCNVKPTLKQNDAMLCINKSPLQRSILNPVADGLRSLELSARNSSPEKVNDCVRDITKGILSPHPLPLLTVVVAKPQSDRLNIIPLLIEKMKSSYRTKVLLCVRTPRALGEIAANICLNQSLRLVIMNKKCDTTPQFQRFILDELVANELKKAAEEDKSVEKINSKNELYIKTKKQILSECDVVLSLVKNSHDDFMGETFIEKECIAQMCCIVDEANLCTEPETLIPILHGISKLILIGDPEYLAKVLSKTARSYDYDRSFFQRAYDLDKLED